MFVRVFSAISLAALLALIVWASLDSHVATGFRYVAADRWGIVTLVDLAVGLWFVGAWIAWRERSFIRALPWWIGLALLGNVTTVLYLAIRGLAPARDTWDT